MAEIREFLNRPLAFTDLETTHINEVDGEIIEVGLLVVDQDSLEIIDEFEAKVKPEHIETASPKSLGVNGYNPEDWKDARDLGSVLSDYAERVEGAMLAAWNYHFEAKFLDAACRKTGLPVGLGMDYHNRGIETLAAEVLRNVKRVSTDVTGATTFETLSRENMKFVANFLGVEPEPEPHRAYHGALTAFRIYERLRRVIDSIDFQFEVLGSGTLAIKENSR